MTGQELKNLADREGIVPTMERFQQALQVEIPLEKSFLELPLSELNLHVRAYNGLMRSRVETVGKLAEAIMSECGLEHIRNLGKTSIYEIKTVLLTEAYARLSEPMRLGFWEKVAEVNRL